MTRTAWRGRREEDGVKRPWTALLCAAVASGALAVAGCGVMDADSEAADATADRRGGGGSAGRGGPGGRGGSGGFPAGAMGSPTSSIPVQVVPVERRTIAQFLQTNGTLEAENEVDLVARTAGPIVELRVEEGMRVARGEVLARIDAEEIEARLQISKVNLEEAELAYERAKAQYENEILSRELFDQAYSRLEAARAQMEENRVQLLYTDIAAPFDGVIVERYVKFAQHVQNGTPLFRISDFDPLECPIQVPEKDLARLQVGQPAYLTVEAFPGERFQARVERISPVVDRATGTVKVTLEVDTLGRLRPGMFASVFLETDRHENALVIPKSALVLESIGDTVYVKQGEVADRREVRLGYGEAERVEVLAGLEEGDEVIVLGQDGLSDGTPVYVLEDAAGSARRTSPGETAAAADTAGEEPVEQSAGQDAAAGRLGAGAGFDPATMPPEMLERMKERMRSRGLSEKEIEERLEALQRGEGSFAPGAGRRPAQP